MTFENEDILPNFVKEHSNGLPIECKVDPSSNRTVYRCHNDFGPLNWRELRKIIPNKLPILVWQVDLTVILPEGLKSTRERRLESTPYSQIPIVPLKSY